MREANKAGVFSYADINREDPDLPNNMYNYSNIIVFVGPWYITEFYISTKIYYRHSSSFESLFESQFKEIQTTNI